MDEFKQYIIEENKLRIDKEYFIDRYGKLHKYKGKLDVEIISMHSKIAYDLYPNIKNAKDFLMNMGWIMVGSFVYSTPIIHKVPSQSQINKLDKLGLYKYLDILHENRHYIRYDKYKSLFDKEL